MKTKRLIYIMCGLLWSCSEQENIEKKMPAEDKTPLENQDLSTRARRHVEAQLGIPATEKYGMQIFLGHLDNDGKEDAIIAVNRLAFAMEKAAQHPNPAKLAEIGFVGNYNLFFFYDAGLDKISPPFAVPSSPYMALEVNFHPITSSTYNDIGVTYRIRNSAYRAFYTISNHNPERYFEWPVFDELGTANAEAFAFDFIPNSANPRKNIRIYEAGIELPDTVTNFYVAQPKLIKKPTVVREFFYLPAKQTYVTKK